MASSDPTGAEAAQVEEGPVAGDEQRRLSDLDDLEDATAQQKIASVVVTSTAVDVTGTPEEVTGTPDEPEMVLLADESIGLAVDIEEGGATAGNWSSRRRLVSLGIPVLLFALLAIGYFHLSHSGGRDSESQVVAKLQSEFSMESDSSSLSVVETTSTTVDLSFLNEPGDLSSRKGSSSGANVSCNVEARANQPIISGMAIVIESVEKISDNPEQWLQVSSLRFSNTLARERTVFQCSGSQVIWNRAAPVEYVTLEPVPPPTTAAPAPLPSTTTSLVP